MWSQCLFLPARSAEKKWKISCQVNDGNRRDLRSLPHTEGSRKLVQDWLDMVLGVPDAKDFGDSHSDEEKEKEPAGDSPKGWVPQRGRGADCHKQWAQSERQQLKVDGRQGRTWSLYKEKEPVDSQQGPSKRKRLTVERNTDGPSRKRAKPEWRTWTGHSDRSNT